MHCRTATPGTDCQAIPTILVEKHMLKHGVVFAALCWAKEGSVEVERRFQGHSQDLGGVKMKKGFFSEGSKGLY